MSKGTEPHRRVLRPIALALILVVLLVQQSFAQAVDPPAGPPITRPGKPGSPPDNHGQQVKRLFQMDDARVPPGAPARAAAAATASDYRIAALDSGYRWSTTNLTYSFYEDSVFHGSYYGEEGGVREVSEAVKANVRQIMAWYSSLLNVSIGEVAETSSRVGLIRIMLSDAPGYAYAYYPYGAAMLDVAGDVHLNPTYDRLGDTNGFQHPAGQHGYVSLAHEIGHTLGLKHPHEAPTLPSAEDNNTNTIMTYQFLGDSPATPMVYDLLALHDIYGAKPKWTGDGSYGFTSRGTDQYALAGTTYVNSPYRTQQTIWDSAGIEVLDFSGLPYMSGGYRLDLKPGGWLVANADYHGTYYDAGTSIGPNVAIEKVIASTSSDTIYANGQPNKFGGYVKVRTAGQDVIYDADGADTLDLSSYAPSEVSRTPSGVDLVLGLGSSGSITLKDYFAGKTPSITYSQPVPTGTTRVAVITMTSVSQGKNKAARAVLKVLNQDGAPVYGATVSGSWSGVVTGSGSGMTDTEGVATITSKNTRSTGLVTFTVTGVSAVGYVYQAGSAPPTITIPLN